MFERLAKKDCSYTAFFCEENIWHLAHHLIRQGVNSQNLLVAFISNTKQQVAVFNQQPRLNLPVIWDYHVILLHNTGDYFLVYDFDSQADFPALANHYLDLSFPYLKKVPAVYQAMFRLIPAADYLKHFSSDRSHMLEHIDEIAFPPEPPIIPSAEHPHIALQQYWDFSLQLPDNSEILTLDELQQKIRY